MPLLAREHAFLAVIDAQPGFYRNRDDIDQAVFERFLETTTWLAATAHALGVPIMLTVEEPAKNGDPAATIIDVLPPETQVHTKATFDLSMEPMIRAAIDRLDPDTAILCGLETDVCVAHSAIGLRDLGFRVAAVTDALFAPGSAHDAGIERLRHAGVELVTAKGLFYEWLPSVLAVRTFKHDHPALARPPFAL